VCRKMNYGSSAPSAPGASTPGTSAPSRCDLSTVGFAPCLSSARTTQPINRIDSVIRRIESDDYFRSSSRRTKQSEMENAEHPSSSSGQNCDPLRHRRRNRRRRLERRRRSELSRPALSLHIPSLTAAPGLALCSLLLRSRYLERHSVKGGVKGDHWGGVKGSQ